MLLKLTSLYFFCDVATFKFNSMYIAITTFLLVSAVLKNKKWILTTIIISPSLRDLKQYLSGTAKKSVLMSDSF